MHNDKNLLSKDVLESLVHLSPTQIAKETGSTLYIVRKSLIIHGLYRGKVHYCICVGCNQTFPSYFNKQKYCSNTCIDQYYSVWNKGLSKEVDIRVANSVDTFKKTYSPVRDCLVYLPNLKKEIRYDGKSTLEKEWLLQIDKSAGVIDVIECPIAIPYIDDHGEHRSYYPDFQVTWQTGVRWIVEVKGFYTDKSYLKTEQAIKWCKENNFQYRLITPGMVKKNSWSTVYSYPKNVSIPSPEWVMMSHAVTWARLSPSTRLQVGAVLSSMLMDEIFAFGYNGDERGGSNIPTTSEPGQDGFIHAEENCLLKNKDSRPSILFVTDSPCLNCAKRIINSRTVKEVYYLRKYRDLSGIGLLIQNGIKTYHFEVTDWQGKTFSDEQAFNYLTPLGLTEL